MADKNRGEEFKSPLCRLRNARKLYTASAYQNDINGRKTYGAELVFPESDRAFLESKVAEVLAKMPKGFERAKAGVIVSPIIDGNGKQAKYQSGENAGEIKPGLGVGTIFIRPTAVYELNGQLMPPPWVRWLDRDTPALLGPGIVYSGCFGKAVLNVYEWTDGKGVSFGISGFQKLQDGEPLGGDGGGASDPSKWVETIENSGEAPAETKTGAGASGLFG